MRILLGLAAIGSPRSWRRALFVYSGVYNVAATEPHAAARVVAAGNRDAPIGAPSRPARSPYRRSRIRARIARGHALHDEHCVRCHGAPGIAPEPFALGLTPSPANLALHCARVAARGVVLGGQVRDPDDGHARVGVSASRTTTCGRSSPIWQGCRANRRRSIARPRPARTHGGPEPARDCPPDAGARQDRDAAVRVRDLPRDSGHRRRRRTVGPPLIGIATRGLHRGHRSQHARQHRPWLHAPQAMHRERAMPDLGLSDRDAGDIAAYLATFK